MSYVHIPSIPETEPISGDFTFTADGENVPVRRVRVSAMPFNTWWPGHQRPENQTEWASYVNFSLSGKTHIEIDFLPRPIYRAEIRPTAFGTMPKIDGRKLSFDLDKPCHFTVEVNGFHGALHVFVSEPEQYDVDIHDSKTIYFPAGVHRAGLIELHSGETLYLDEGAVVYGSVFAKDAENIRVLGRGVIDSSPFARVQEYTGTGKPSEEILDALRARNVGGGIGNVLMCGCKNVLIDGVIFRDPPEWSYNIYHSENVKIHDVKLIGLWRYNADGIDIYLGKHFEISDSFIRSFDDSIVARGACGSKDEDIFEDMNVHNCVLWCDWGRAIEMWTSERPAHLKNIVFRDCYIIRTAHVAIDLQIYGSGPTRMENILCENIYVDTDRHADRPVYQKTDLQVYDGAAADDYLQILIFIGNAYKFETPKNRLGFTPDVVFKNVTLRNIRVNAHRAPQSIIKTLDGYMRTENVLIDGVYRNGTRLENAADMNLDAPQGAYTLL